MRVWKFLDINCTVAWMSGGIQLPRRRRSSLITPGTGQGFSRRSSSSSLGQHPDLTKMWSNSIGKSTGLIPGRKYIGPLFLTTVSPVFVMILYHTLVHLDGSLARFLLEIKADGLASTITYIWPSVRDVYVWKMIGVFMGVQLLILKIVPGRTVRGPVTPGGNVPIYNGNGLQAFVITVALFLAGAHYGLYKGGILYDKLGEILATMNVFALIFCLVLYLKGLSYPSSSDCGSSGNPIFDFYWGTELYPRFFGRTNTALSTAHWRFQTGWDVKQFTNCRCGMMFWALFLISATLKQQEIYGSVSNAMMVNVGIQLVYITKFYIWESGYLATMDIMHDRAGFYICWGCLCFLPCVYTSHTVYLVIHPNNLSGTVAATMFVAGVIFILINYDCDRQRQVFRSSGGRAKIWGREPVGIEAKYKTEKGELRSTLLLTSGWWGVSRHFHYVPEIAAAILWTIPVSSTQVLPYFYIPYLILLLTDRAYRDDARCKSKYGKYWKQYCYLVPYMILPKIV